MGYEMKRLKARQRKILDLKLDGLKNTEIATQLGVTPQTVSNTCGATLAQVELARRRDIMEAQGDEITVVERLSARDILQGAAQDAAEAQIGLMNLSQNEKIRQVAAMDILDRAGVPKVSSQNSTSFSASVVLSEEAVLRLQKATKDVFNVEIDLETEMEAKQVI
jgi:DNA-binding CsgD family transcriptional regulator